MKKKVFLIVAIILIALIACMALVACDGNVGGDDSVNNGNDSEEIIGGGNNQGGNIENGGNESGNNNENIISPNPTIKEFMSVWKASSSKSFYQPCYGDTKFTIYGNIFMQSDFETIKYLEITKKNNANYFYGHIDDTDFSHWEILKLDSIEDICTHVNIDIEVLPEVSTPKDIINVCDLMVFGDNDPDLLYEKKDDGIFYGIKDSIFENSTIKIVGNDLIFNFQFAYGDTREGKFIFSIGSDPITIPQSLRDALENIQS